MNTSLKKENILLKGIGEIEYKHSKKAKYIRIVIGHNSQVSVVIPNHHNIREAIEFVNSKKNH